MNIFCLKSTSWLCGLLSCISIVLADEGAKVVSYYGYEDCIQLENATTQVILCPAAGGRILVYSLNGKNVLYLPSGNEGWVWNGQAGGAPMNAGRFDIGPEQVIPRHTALWQGRWQGKILGPRQAELLSEKDMPTGVQLLRKFTLAPDSSRLECTQQITNISNETVEYCHWSRTFVVGGGIGIVPVTKPSRFPQGYVRYDNPGSMINTRPSDPNVVKQGDFLIVAGAPKFPKLGFDSTSGWFAYLSKNDLMMVKEYPTYPDRVYNEVAGLTLCIWYPDGAMCELEPTGPRERLSPGQSASFTETWRLADHPFPSDASKLDALEIAKTVKALTK